VGNYSPDTDDVETYKEPTVAPEADPLEAPSAIDAAFEQLSPRGRPILREFLPGREEQT
jgi:hypothetical protein